MYGFAPVYGWGVYGWSAEEAVDFQVAQLRLRDVAQVQLRALDAPIVSAKLRDAAVRVEGSDSSLAPRLRDAVQSVLGLSDKP